MRKFLIALVLLVGIMFIIARMAEVEAIFDTFKRGDWRFLSLAFAIEGMWLLNVAGSFKTIYRALGVEEKIEHLLVMSAAANFVNVVTPSAGMGGMAIFISEARHRNYSAGRATVAGALYVLFDYAGFLCVLALGLIVLFRRNNLNITELIASGIFVLIAIVLGILLYLGTRSSTALGNTLAWMAQQVNKVVRPFLNREYLSEERAYSFAKDASNGLKKIRRNPNDLIFPGVLALTNKVLLIAILLCMFMAYDLDLSIGTLIAGFSISYLFMIVSPTPSGVGFVEGALTLTLHSFFIPLGPSAVVALSYRGITFWVPLIFGMVAFRWLGKMPQAAEMAPPEVPD